MTNAHDRQEPSGRPASVTRGATTTGSSDAAPAGIAPRASTTDTSFAGARREPIRSETLFAGAGEVQIVHRGALYRLRQTALGKLILTK